MKSPFTGKEMTLKHERRAVEYRKESFDIEYHFYVCEDTHEQFTDTQVDEYNTRLLQNQYRAKHNIPFPDEIKATRGKYGLSAAKMSQILGFGPNGYRQYEAGEVPSLSNARLLRSASNPDFFYQLVKESWETEDQDDKEKVLKKVEAALEILEENDEKLILWQYFLGAKKAELLTGYRIPDINKFADMVSFFAVHCRPYKTKMNKLLFYADFLAFKEGSRSISGIRYAAIDYGPVPHNFQSIYEYLSNENIIDIAYHHFNNGHMGEQFKPAQQRKIETGNFSPEELDIMNRVVKKFKNSSTSEIVQYSHLERAWKDNAGDKGLISYEYAFDLRVL